MRWGNLAALEIAPAADQGMNDTNEPVSGPLWPIAHQRPLSDVLRVGLSAVKLKAAFLHGALRTLKGCCMQYALYDALPRPTVSNWAGKLRMGPATCPPFGSGFRNELAQPSGSAELGLRIAQRGCQHGRPPEAAKTVCPRGAQSLVSSGDIFLPECRLLARQRWL